VIRPGAAQGAAPPRGAWSAVGAGFAVLFVCTGVNQSFGILFKPILNEFGGDRGTLSFAATASLLVYALSQLFFGPLIDRFGPRRVMLPSMALMVLGTALVSTAGSPWQMTLLYGVVAAVGYTGTGILPVSVYVARWFPGRGGFPMAVAATGFSLGHLVFTQVAAHAAEAMGWRRTYLLLAVLLLIGLAAFAVWLREPPRLPVASGPPETAAAQSGSLNRRAAMATAAFWWMTAAYIGCGFTDFLIVTHLAPFASDLGLGQARAANALSLLAAANIAGILGAGSASDRLGTRRALAITYGLRAASLCFLFLVRETWELYLFAVLFGATFFTTAPLSSAFVGELFGPRHQGSIFGAANMFHHFGAALGAYAGGLAFDLTQSYRGVFIASAVLVAASAAVTAVPRPPRRPSR